MTQTTQNRSAASLEPIAEVHSSRNDIVFVSVPSSDQVNESVYPNFRRAFLNYCGRLLRRIAQRVVLTLSIVAVLNLSWLLVYGSWQTREMLTVSKFILPFAFLASYFLPRFLTQKVPRQIGSKRRWFIRLWFAAAFLTTIPFAALPWMPAFASAIRVHSLVLKQPKTSRVRSEYGIKKLRLRYLIMYAKEKSLFERPEFYYQGTLDNLAQLSRLDEVVDVRFDSDPIRLPSKAKFKAAFTPRTQNWLETRLRCTIALDNRMLATNPSAREDFDSILMQLAGLTKSAVYVSTDLQHSVECVELLESASNTWLHVDLQQIEYQSPEWSRALENGSALSHRISNIDTKHLDTDIADAMLQAPLFSVHCETLDAESMSKIDPAVANNLTLIVSAAEPQQLKEGIAQWPGKVLTLRVMNDISNSDILAAIPASVTQFTLTANLTDQDLANFEPSQDWQFIRLGNVQFTKSGILEFLARLDKRTKGREKFSFPLPSLFIHSQVDRSGLRLLSDEEISEIYAAIESWQPSFTLHFP